jgi:putative FmdB family regulatory protein
MPLFEYVCSDCQNRFELLIRGDEKPQCPACSGRKVEKQLSVPAAHTAGGGKSASFDTPCGMPPGSCGRQCGMGM